METKLDCLEESRAELISKESMKQKWLKLHTKFLWIQLQRKGDYMCDVVRRFLDSIAELKGNEYVKRAITYMSTFIPEEKRNEMELLDFCIS